MSAPSALYSRFAFIVALLCFFPLGMALSQQAKNVTVADTPRLTPDPDEGFFEEDEGDVPSCMDSDIWGACFVPMSENDKPPCIDEGPRYWQEGEDVIFDPDTCRYVLIESPGPDNVLDDIENWFATASEFELDWIIRAD